MTKNLRFILGGLVLATNVGFGELDNLLATSTNNAPLIAKTKIPEITSFNTIYTNNLNYVEIRGKPNNANLRKYSLQSNTNLASNTWRDIALLDDCADSKKEEFVFYDPINSERKFYRVHYTK